MTENGAFGRRFFRGGWWFERLNRCRHQCRETHGRPVGAGRRDSARCLGYYAVHHVTLGDIAAHHRAPEPFEQHEAHRA